MDIPLTRYHTSSERPDPLVTMGLTPWTDRILNMPWIYIVPLTRYHTPSERPGPLVTMGLTPWTDRILNMPWIYIVPLTRYHTPSERPDPLVTMGLNLRPKDQMEPRAQSGALSTTPPKRPYYTEYKTCVVKFLLVVTAMTVYQWNTFINNPFQRQKILLYNFKSIFFFKAVRHLYMYL